MGSPVVYNFVFRYFDILSILLFGCFPILSLFWESFTLGIGIDKTKASNKETLQKMQDKVDRLELFLGLFDNNNFRDHQFVHALVRSNRQLSKQIVSLSESVSKERGEIFNLTYYMKEKNDVTDASVIKLSQLEMDMQFHLETWYGLQFKQVDALSRLQVIETGYQALDPRIDRLEKFSDKVDARLNLNKDRIKKIRGLVERYLEDTARHGNCGIGNTLERLLLNNMEYATKYRELQQQYNSILTKEVPALEAKIAAINCNCVH